MDLDRVPSSEERNEEAEVEVGVEVGLGRASSEAILIPLDRATLEGCVSSEAILIPLDRATLEGCVFVSLLALLA